jgi:hypothetical protein
MALRSCLQTGGVRGCTSFGGGIRRVYFATDGETFKKWPDAFACYVEMEEKKIRSCCVGSGIELI